MFKPVIRQVFWIGLSIMWTLLVLISQHAGLPLFTAQSNSVGAANQATTATSATNNPLLIRGLLIGEQDKVTQVVPGSAADMTDVRVGDILQAINDTPVGAADAAQLNASIAGQQQVILTLRRPGHSASIVATLADPDAGQINP